MTALATPLAAALRAVDKVIGRWYRVGLLRFNSHNDGSDDLLLRDEIVREWAATPQLALLAEVLEAAEQWRDAQVDASTWIGSAVEDRLKSAEVSLSMAVDGLRGGGDPS